MPESQKGLFGAKRPYTSTRRSSVAMAQIASTWYAECPNTMRMDWNRSISRLPSTRREICLIKITNGSR